MAPLGTVHQFGRFLFGLLVILGVPGPTNIILITAGATLQATTPVRRMLLLLMLEIAAYDVTVAAAHAVLLPAIIRFPAAVLVVKAVAAVYLVCLAVALWHASLRQESSCIRAQDLFVTTLLNPKGLVIGLVLIPGPARTVGLHLAVLSVAAPLTGAVWLGAGRLMGQSARQTFLFRNAGRRMDTFIPKAASISLAVFAGLLIMSLVNWR
ncbi:MAG: hypothetical protein ACRD06_04700 [Terriglobia bacterium]